MYSYLSRKEIWSWQNVTMKSVKIDNFVYTAEATKDDFFMLWIICPIFVKQ